MRAHGTRVARWVILWKKDHRKKLKKTQTTLCIYIWQGMDDTLVDWTMPTWNPYSQWITLLSYVWPTTSGVGSKVFFTEPPKFRLAKVLITTPFRLCNRQVQQGPYKASKWCSSKFKCKGHFTQGTEGPWPLHFKHSHWWKRCSWRNSLQTALEGPTEYVNARWM